MAHAAYNTRTDATYSNTISGTGSALADKAGAIAEKAGEHIDQAVDKAASTARSLSEQGREATERVNEVAGNLKSAVDKSLSDQPMATLAIAATLGFVLGAVWKS
ncbi:MAG: hypothetical protein JNM89_13620 [Hyphomicrobiaceae bacterium]|nr:hypothetical protein [Hyphomicrobiaceae bacterium]